MPVINHTSFICVSVTEIFISKTFKFMFIESNQIKYNLYLWFFSPLTYYSPSSPIGENMSRGN